MQFSNTFNKLDESFFRSSLPTPASNPQLFLWNDTLASQIGIAKELLADTKKLAAIFAGNSILPGSEPIASTYAGHQFGHFNPQLGDGRAHLLGEVIDNNQNRMDIQLKGSGPTPFSRGGDGRCALGPAVREFIMSEAMYALRVPTTRCLAVVTTGDPVYRETASPGAVVTRIASSHLRVGSFEFFAARGEQQLVDTLCDYAINRHFPELNNTSANKYLSLIEHVIEKQIALVIEWMRVGFIHGVMNTDNTAISGETIDYGPCAMLGVYDLDTTYSSIDHMGRYAYGRQADIAHWNMLRFTECLLPLIDKKDTVTLDKLQALLVEFPDRFHLQFMQMMARKLGLKSCDKDDQQFITAFLDTLATRQLDYTLTFNLLTRSLHCEKSAQASSHALGEQYEHWLKRVNEQNTATAQVQSVMRQNNPVVIPRNHHLEAVIKQCESSGSSKAAEEFISVLRSPYSETPLTTKFQGLPEDNDSNYKTFCGT